MYEAYWQLHQKPFEGTADPRFYYPGEPQQAAILKLRYAIENRRSAALLCGASGTGKTLVGGMLRAALDGSFAPIVHLVFPQMTTAELLGYLADEMGQLDSSAGPVGTQQSIRRIERFLAENTSQGRHAVLIVDEAHLIHQSETFEALRLLLNFEYEGQSGLTLLFTGQTSLLTRMERMPALEERL
ncbi:MAG: AAA family ATPase, partial [Patescibacteria group bacterium]|nr:AAA family ATPase [Patescibacteria group bacterium]